jgi:hypothetical protein
MRHDLNLDTHIILSQTRYTDTSPQRLMVGHPLLEVAHHRVQRLIVDRDMIRVDAKDLGPALASSILQTPLDIGKGEVNLGIDLLLEFACFGIPAT